MQKLPPEIGALSQLLQLYVDGNQLKFLPIEIDKLTKLQELNLIDNDFEGIPEEVLQREAKEIIQYILAWQHKSLVGPKISPCCRRQWHPVKVHAWTA